MISPEELRFNDLLKDDFACSELVKKICSLSSLTFTEKRIYEGSRILYEIGNDRVVKVFSPHEKDFCENEACHLKLLHGKLSATTPELILKGIHDGYPFIVMQKLEGSPLKSVWNLLSIWEKKCILGQIADILKELHSITLEQTESRGENWNSFISSQRINLLKNHSEFGLDHAWTKKIIQFIQNTDPIEFSSTTAICHTEIMKEHIFVTKGLNGFKVTGLIDFEPSMAAIPEYDFCSVGLFVSAGEEGLFKHFLKSYGYRGSSTGIMRMLLLHRYSNMKWFISTIPDSLDLRSIEDLSNYWF